MMLKFISHVWSISLLTMVTILLGYATYNALFNTYSYQVVQHLDDLPAFNTADADVVLPTNYPALVRIHTSEDRFNCSGFVASNDYVITAAHCLVGPTKQMIRTPFYIRHLDSKNDTKILAKAVAVNVSGDLGLIQGDFSKFNKMKIDPLPSGPFTTPGPFRTCGFPYGDSDLCTQFTPRSNFFEFIYGSGFLFPGMSGGPVQSMTTGAAIAVNTGINEGGVIVAPLIGLFLAAEVEVK